MAKHKRASRWVEFDFLGQVQTQHPERYRLKLDANLIHSWHVTRAEGEPDTSICVVFVGLGTKELGRVMIDLIEYGLCFAPTINDLIYEARHPWLDVKDAKRKKAFGTGVMPLLFFNGNPDKTKGSFGVTTAEWVQMSVYENWAAFKPIDPAEYYRFAHVEAWKG